MTINGTAWGMSGFQGEALHNSSLYVNIPQNLFKRRLDTPKDKAGVEQYECDALKTIQSNDDAITSVQCGSVWDLHGCQH